LSGKLNSGTSEKALDVAHEFERWLDNDLWRGKQRFLIDTGSAIPLIRKDRQGCSLSPILFNIYLEKTLDHWKKSCERIVTSNKIMVSL
jgi:Reverse transcriptase (RNA-dependent DNA polymerase).